MSVSASGGASARREPAARLAPHQPLAARVNAAPCGRSGLVSFVLPEVHAHDVVTMADHHGIALRGGHHCNQPLMRRFKVPSTARASVYFYNTLDEVDEMIDIVREAVLFFGDGDE